MLRDFPASSATCRTCSDDIRAAPDRRRTPRCRECRYILLARPRGGCLLEDSQTQAQPKPGTGRGSRHTKGPIDCNSQTGNHVPFRIRIKGEIVRRALPCTLPIIEQSARRERKKMEFCTGRGSRAAVKRHSVDVADPLIPK